MPTYVMVDVESDGPVPPLYSMVCFGAVICEPKLERTFYGQTRPISERFDPEALAISGFSREEHEKFQTPLLTMIEFERWLDNNCEGRPIFISDNPAYDFQWINYYFHNERGNNPFGWSARRLGDLFCGFNSDLRFRWKNNYRKTQHDHNPVNDARGNAEAFLTLMSEMRVK